MQFCQQQQKIEVSRFLRLVLCPKILGAVYNGLGKSAPPPPLALYVILKPWQE